MKVPLWTTTILCLASAFVSNARAQSGSINGLGGTSLTCIDKDSDGYGVGPGCLGPDADDNDATVHGAADVVAKYGSLSAFLSHLGYAPNRIWYLSPSAKDSMGAVNDSARPYQTFASISSLVAAGDMVLFRAGTYNQQITLARSGNPGHPIVLMAYPGEKVTIDFAGQRDGGLYVVNDSWIIIDGLRLLNSAGSGGRGISGGTYYAPGTTGPSLFHHITIRNVEVLRAYWGIILMNGLRNVTIEDCAIHDSTNEHNVYLGSRDIVSSNVTVRRSLLFNSAADGNGFQFNGRVTNLVIEQNIVYSNMLSGISLLEGVSSSYIRNNAVFNNGRNAIIIFNYDGDCLAHGPICPYDQTNNIIENNTLYSSGHDRSGAASAQSAILVSNGSTGKVGNLGGNTFRNNIIIGTGVGGHYPAVEFSDANKSYLSTSIFENNIFWADDGPNDKSVIGFGRSAAYGYAGKTCADAQRLTRIRGCVNADPRLSAVSPKYYATPEKFNLAPLAGSPAIRAGSPKSAPLMDIRGVVRANPPTIGAYEYSRAAPARIIAKHPMQSAVITRVSVTAANSTKPGSSAVVTDLITSARGMSLSSNDGPWSLLEHRP